MLAGRLIILIATLAQLFALPGYGQAVSKADSVAVLHALDKLFATFKQSSQAQFESLAAQSISCILCAEEAARNGREIQSPYLVGRQVFFQQYLPALKKTGVLQRAYQKRNIRLVRDAPALLTVLIVTWMPGEYASGHEGAQLEVSFTKQNRAFQFSGLSTIP